MKRGREGESGGRGRRGAGGGSSAAWWAAVAAIGDEEDVEGLLGAGGGLRTAAGYSSRAGHRDVRSSAAGAASSRGGGGGGGGVAATLLHDEAGGLPPELLAPALPQTASHGHTILTRMGWRPGSYLGSALSRARAAAGVGSATLAADAEWEALERLWALGMERQAAAVTTGPRSLRGLGYTHVSLAAMVAGEGDEEGGSGSSGVGGIAGAAAAAAAAAGKHRLALGDATGAAGFRDTAEDRAAARRSAVVARAAVHGIGVDDGDDGGDGVYGDIQNVYNSAAEAEGERARARRLLAGPSAHHRPMAASGPAGSAALPLLASYAHVDGPSFGPPRTDDAVATAAHLAARYRPQPPPASFVPHHVFTEPRLAPPLPPPPPRPPLPTAPSAPSPAAATAAAAAAAAAAWSDSRFVAPAAERSDATAAAAGPQLPPQAALPPATAPGTAPRAVTATRTVTTWMPEPLLLKRFNVPDPFSRAQRAAVAPGGAGDRAGSRFTPGGSIGGSDGGGVGGGGGGGGGGWDDAAVPLPPAPPAATDLAPLTAPKPPPSLFAAIFGE